MTASMLDIEQPEQLDTYLRINGQVTADERIGIELLAGGVSNRTVLVSFADGRQWVMKQSLEKLRVAVDWFSDPARIEREVQGLRWLPKLAPPGTITPLVFEDRRHHLFAMQAVPQPHDNWKTLLLAGTIDLNLVQQFGVLLATIHRRAESHRSTLAQEFSDRSFFETLRLEPYFTFAAGQVASAAEFLNRLVEETRSRNDSLVHGDYSPKNILIHQHKLVLLDHEVIHWGDPAFDLGFSLTHFLSKAHHLPTYRQQFAVAADRYWQVYLETLGNVPWADDLAHRVVRQTLGCLLARVAGRSPLEYLDDHERARQRHVVLDLLPMPPTNVEDLVVDFLAGVDRYAHD